MSMRDLLRARSEAPLEALELGPIIGRGSFGRVYRGQAAAFSHPHCPWLLSSQSLLVHCSQWPGNHCVGLLPSMHPFTACS